MTNTGTRSWLKKFGDAASGVRVGVRGQASFRVHWLMAMAVLICGLAFRVSQTEWCILLLCITSVISAELMNSAIEYMARAVAQRDDRNIGAALDVASGAVLIASMGASTVGLIVFINRLRMLVEW